jgi:hypothetical protein
VSAISWPIVAALAILLAGAVYVLATEYRWGHPGLLGFAVFAFILLLKPVSVPILNRLATHRVTQADKAVTGALPEIDAARKALEKSVRDNEALKRDNAAFRAQDVKRRARIAELEARDAEHVRRRAELDSFQPVVPVPIESRERAMEVLRRY